MRRLFKAFLPPASTSAIASAIIIHFTGDSIRRGSVPGQDGVLIALGLCGAAALAAGLFFLPTIIAGLRDSPSYTGVLIVNIVGSLFAGIGWLVALAWACFDRRQPPVVVQQHFYNQQPPPTP